MTVPAGERFTAVYRRLSLEQRREFVADLWDVCGWETDLEGELVVARRDGAVRRIDVDTDDAAVAALSIRPDGECTHLDFEALGNRLLYGTDRSSADRVTREHFEADLTDLLADRVRDVPGQGVDGSTLEGQTAEGEDASLEEQTAEGEDASLEGQTAEGDGSTLEGQTDEGTHSPDRAAMSPSSGSPDRTATSPSSEWSRDGSPVRSSRLLVAIVFVGLGLGVVALTLGVGGFGPVAESESEATAPDATEPASAERDRTILEDNGDMTGPPPGVSEDEIDDIDQLAAAHTAVVDQIDSQTLSLSAEGSDVAMPSAFPDAGNLEYSIEDGTYHVRQDVPTMDQQPPQDIEYFAEGDQEYLLIEYGQEPLYDRRQPSAEPNASARSAEIGADLLTATLPEGEATTTRTTVDGIDGYELTTTTPPPDVDTDDYRASAFVTESGVVLEVTVTYTYDRIGEEVSVELTYEDIGETTVTRPPWYEDARVATG